MHDGGGCPEIYLFVDLCSSFVLTGSLSRLKALSISLLKRFRSLSQSLLFCNSRNLSVSLFVLLCFSLSANCLCNLKTLLVWEMDGFYYVCFGLNRCNLRAVVILIVMMAFFLFLFFFFFFFWISGWLSENYSPKSHRAKLDHI